MSDGEIHLPEFDLGTKTWVTTVYDGDGSVLMEEQRFQEEDCGMDLFINESVQDVALGNCIAQYFESAQRLYMFWNGLDSARSLFCVPSHRRIVFRGENTGDFTFLCVAVVRDKTILWCSICDTHMNVLDQVAICSPAFHGQLDAMSFGELETTFETGKVQCLHKQALQVCMTLRDFNCRLTNSPPRLYDACTESAGAVEKLEGLFGKTLLYKCYAVLCMNNLRCYNDWAVVSVNVKTQKFRCRLCLRSACSHTESLRRFHYNGEHVLRREDRLDSVPGGEFPVNVETGKLCISPDCMSFSAQTHRVNEEEDASLVVRTLQLSAGHNSVIRIERDGKMTTSAEEGCSDWSVYTGRILFSTFDIHQVNEHEEAIGLELPGLLKMRTAWFTVELLRKWWSTWILAPTNYRAFWKVQVFFYGNQSLSRLSTDVCHKLFTNHRSTFRKACINFEILCDVEYDHAFGGACEDECKHLVMDGTYGGFQKNLLHFDYVWKEDQPKRLDLHLWSPLHGVASFFELSREDFYVDAPMVDKKVIETEENALQKLLYKFAQRENVYDKKKTKVVRTRSGMTLKQLVETKEALTKLQNGNLRMLSFFLEDAEAIEVTIRKEKVVHFFCRCTHLAKLLEALASTYSVMGVIQISFHERLQTLLSYYGNGEDSLLGDSYKKFEDEKKTIMFEAPLIYNVLEQHTNKWNDYLPQAIVFLLQCIMRLQRQYSDDLPAPSHYRSLEGEEDDDYYSTGMYYPGMPLRRTIPSNLKDISASSYSACNKHYPGSNGATPGIFKIFCLDCQRQVGFHVQKWSESCRTPFEIIRSRWLFAPSLICYDNACNFSNYALAREPEWFGSSKFIIDYLHSKGHVRCSPAHSPYVHDNLLRSLNTQQCEQSNSRHSQAFRTQTYFMTQTMFLFHVRLHMFFHQIRTFHE